MVESWLLLDWWSGCPTRLHYKAISRVTQAHQKEPNMSNLRNPTHRITEYTGIFEIGIRAPTRCKATLSMKMVSASCLPTVHVTVLWLQQPQGQAGGQLSPEAVSAGDCWLAVGAAPDSFSTAAGTSTRPSDAASSAMVPGFHSLTRLFLKSRSASNRDSTCSRDTLIHHVMITLNR